MQTPSILLADCGSTKANWCLVTGTKRRFLSTQGMSPYFLNSTQMAQILSSELVPGLRGKDSPDTIYFYGTGCSNPQNIRIVRHALRSAFPDARLEISHDLMGAARATCGHEGGIACILGTGSNSGYYNGYRILKNSPGLGYILGDEGSGAYLGRKVLQYYLYQTFDGDLKTAFDRQFATDRIEILDQVYKKPMANRYLASFAPFLSENRGHYMVENILEDGLNDFFFQHIFRYAESWTRPIHFVGSIAWVFRDILAGILSLHQLEPGKILASPLEGLIPFHTGEPALVAKPGSRKKPLT